MKKAIYLLFYFLFSSIVFSCNNQKSIGVSKVTTHDKDVFINYVTAGNGDTTLLFVHGWCINSSYWSNQIAFFSNKYRVVAIDLPGFGKSGKNRSDWSTQAYGDDIDSVIKQLHLKKVILIGHSMAGDIVLQSAIDNPANVIGLVGVDNFKNVDHKQTPQDKKAFADAIVMLKHNFKSVALQYFKQDLFSSTTSAAIKKRVLNDVAQSDTTIAAATMEQGNNFDELVTLRKLKVKLYLINSDVHPTDTVGLVKNKISFQLLYIHGKGHFPMIEDPGDFNSLLEKVISEIKSK